LSSALVAYDLGDGILVEAAGGSQRLAQHADRFARGQAQRAADGLAHHVRIGRGAALLEYAGEEVLKLGCARQRQCDAARVALELDGQLYQRAHQHDALFARAERGQQVAQAAHRRGVVEPAVGVEQGEDRGLFAAFDGLEPGVEGPGAFAGDAETGRDGPDDAAPLGALCDAFEQVQGALFLERLEDGESPARAHQQAQLFDGGIGAHSASTVTRATSS
jgi:hypothetical protein